MKTHGEPMTPETAALFAALGHPGRLAALQHIAAAGSDGAASGDVAAAIGVTAAASSYYLKDLTNAGLVRVERSGRNRFYRARIEALRVMECLIAEMIDHAE